MLKSVATILAATSSIASADSFNWLIDANTSSLTTTISATLGTTLSDTKTTKVAGFVAGDIGLPAYSFGSIHITSADMSYTTNPTFNLTQFLLGGVTITTNGLGFAIPGPNNLGFASPTPASVDLAGNFSQLGNGAEGRGTMTYTGVGIVGSSVGTGTINLLDQSPLPLDFVGTVSQNGNQLLLTLPVSIDQTTVQNNILVRVQINGTVFAKGTATAGGWKSDADGAWSTASNWSSNVVPQSLTPIDTAVLGPVITQPRTITLPSPGDWQVKRLIIDSEVAYQLAGGVYLSGTSPSLEVRRGTEHTLERLVNGGPAEARVADGARIQISAINGSGLLTKTGTGVLEIDSGYSGPVVIDAGSIRATSSLRVRNSLTVSAGAKLDLRDARFQLDYDSDPASARDAIRALIIRGRAGGTWTGDGISSSLLSAGSNRALGYGDSEELAINTWGGQPASTAVLVRLTLIGDADLDGAVDFDDLLRMAQAYGGTGFWSGGDFTHDGVVNFDDLLGLAQNYGSTLGLAEQSRLGQSFVQEFALAQSLLPEPMILAMVPAMFARRRRHP